MGQLSHLLTTYPLVLNAVLVPEAGQLVEALPEVGGEPLEGGGAAPVLQDGVGLLQPLREEQAQDGGVLTHITDH